MLVALWVWVAIIILVLILIFGVFGYYEGKKIKGKQIAGNANWVIPPPALVGGGGLMIQYQVLDPNGAPIVGANVRFTMTTDNAYLGGGFHSLDLVTDAQGIAQSWLRASSVGSDTVIVFVKIDEKVAGGIQGALMQGWVEVETVDVETDPAQP